VPTALDLYLQSPNFNTANFIGPNIIIPLAPYFSASQIQQLIEKSAQNSQVFESSKLWSVLKSLGETEIISYQEFDQLLARFGFSQKYFYPLFADRCAQEGS
jgi:hypothetical protein